MIDRRAFLRWLLATPIAATVDVEQLLWVPKPIVTVPAMPQLFFHPNAFEMVMNEFHVGDVFTLQGRYRMDPVTRQPTSHLQQFVVTDHLVSRGRPAGIAYRTQR